jgi:hypothetical protein
LGPGRETKLLVRTYNNNNNNNKTFTKISLTQKVEFHGEDGVREGEGSSPKNVSMKIC